ncbi:sugar ABC transporter substrate-binding protein [Kaistia algarum]|uniref:sugar ABC transporter substrate-binding protein n=1 Tax=Kaistia algarum TaxID=2083279 RepID=UPI001402D501|nr:substrate-binding domain-containing protein [Kaistia algarum]MCX5515771.1 substrate-binding domain-containing protein [Kaistia algarum]
MNSFAKLGSIAAVMAAFTMATPIMSTQAQAADPLNIWYVNPLPNTPDWGRSGKIFQDQAAAMGYKATLVGPTKLDVPAMISQIEQAIADKADGIITCSLDPAAFKSVIDEAKAAGIIVASIGCVDPNADFSVGTGNEAYGKLSADLVAEHTGGKAQVGIVATDQTQPNQVRQVKGFREQLAAKYPDIKELTWESDNSDAGVAAQKIGAMVSAYPDMNYIWIIEGAAPGAVPAALSEAGKKAGDIKVLAVDAQNSTLKGIEDGWVTATLNQCWFNASANIGKLMVEMKATGKHPQAFYEIPVDPVTKERLPYSGCPAENSSKPFGY